MRITIVICLVLAVFTTACHQNPSAVNADSPNQTHSTALPECKSKTSLLYEDEGISSYTEDSIHGAGIISFELNINDRLAIYDLNGDVFGEIVLNADGTYFTLNMPQKTIARHFIPTQDFAAFDFDAEPIDTDRDYLLIYINKEKRKVKKAQLKYVFHTWPEYLKSNTIRLKPCNLLKASNGKIIEKSLDQFFEITAVKGDRIEIKSTKECQIDGPYLEMQGWVKWRSADGLIIDFASCD